MIINDDRRFVFVHTPKVAGTSIRIALAAIPGLNKGLPKRTKHETPDEIVARLTEATADGPAAYGRADLDSYLFFCFVRNPWDRFASLHRYLQRTHMDRLPVPETLAELARLLEDDVEWVRKLHSVRPQTEFAAAPVSLVGRYETLFDDLAAVGSRLGVDLAIGKLNAAPTAVDYRTLYDARSHDIIAARYAGDIAAFGYSFESAEPARPA